MCINTIIYIEYIVLFILCSNSYLFSVIDRFSFLRIDPIPLNRRFSDFGRPDFLPDFFEIRFFKILKIATCAKFILCVFVPVAVKI